MRSRAVLIESGAYLETGTATRDFSETSLVSVSFGGRIELVGEGHTVGDSQRLEVNNASFTSPGGLTVAAGGSFTTDAIGGAISIITAPTTLEAGSTMRVRDAGLTRFELPFEDRGAQLWVQDGGTAEFRDDYTGTGAIGEGLLRFQGGTRIAAGAQYETDVEWAEQASLVLTLRAESLSGEPPAATEEPLVDVEGSAVLSGMLTLENVGLPPLRGDEFLLLNAAPLSGSIDGFQGPDLAPGLEWRLLQTETSLTAQVVTPSLAGDFNYDGFVDAADYTVWRDTLGSEGPMLAADANGDEVVDLADRDAWRVAYGTGTPVIAVPEPAAWLLLLGAVLAPRR